MKNILAALAATTLAGGAAAQSSVTLFGVADITFQHVANDGAATVNRLFSGGHTASRIGVRGREDLGGGLGAGFWLEAGLQVDNGVGGSTNISNQPAGAALPGLAGGQGLTFGRRSTVSLFGNWGELRLGRDVRPEYLNTFWYDPWNNGGVASSQVANSMPNFTVAAVRASNGIGYLTPDKLGGFFGQAVYFLGENPSTPAAASGYGKGYGVRVGYKSGPFEVAAGAGHTSYATGDQTTLNVGGYWDFGIARVMGIVQRDEIRTNKNRGALIGAIIPAGPGAVKVSYSQYRTAAAGPDPTSKKFGIGYVYDLSKRTVLFTTASKVRNSNGANASAAGGTSGGAGLPAINQSSSGFEVGVRHVF